MRLCAAVLDQVYSEERRENHGKEFLGWKREGSVCEVTKSLTSLTYPRENVPYWFHLKCLRRESVKEPTAAKGSRSLTGASTSTKNLKTVCQLHVGIFKLSLPSSMEHLHTVSATETKRKPCNCQRERKEDSEMKC